MMAIDTLGTILRFNKAAESCFGRAAIDVIDQNVKILMPEEIAARHDTHLATYLRTKQKHVLVNLTRQRAVRKNGEEFPIEMIVRELVNDNVSTYLGFIRDLSSDSHLDEAMLLKDIFMESTGVAVLCTDVSGRVVLYSHAAEAIFGFTAAEVINNNCKMLMPPAVGDKYDAYLERYRNALGQRATLPLLE
uniref:Sensor protein fixL n=1 Tax=Lygus hesperus TaxID=30085 RepID=A0A0A9ZJ31_LYGHE